MTFGQKKEGKEQRKFFRQIVGRQKKTRSNICENEFVSFKSTAS